MCGIAGLRSPHSSAEMEPLLNAMVHRGPDDAGTFFASGWMIGLRRLAVIDIAGGHQPMTSANGQWTLVMNGEIYNFKELRSQLAQIGISFRTSSDSEVLIECVAQWGVPATLERLEGMFAFAALDRATGDLWLARDRFGEKPLFIDRREGGFAFASELTPLLQRPLARRMDVNAIILTLRLGFPWPGTTPVSGLNELLPAHWLHVRADGFERVGRYWAPPDRVDEQVGGIKQCSTKLLSLLDESVRSRLISDVPLGLFLSGGVDSGAVASSAAMCGRIKAVTVGFSNDDYDERALARATAERLGLELFEQTGAIDPFNPEIFDDYLCHYGQPFADMSAFPTRTVSRAARQHYTVALSGDGGDEIFGGYLSHMRVHKLIKFGAGKLGATLSSMFAARFRSDAGDGLGRALQISASRLDDSVLWSIGGHFDDDSVASFADLKRNPLFQQARDDSRELWRRTPDPLLALSLHQLKTELPQDILMKVDRMSMAESLEVRSPMLDSKLASFALSLPAHLKIGGGLGKLLLREALGGRLPDKVLSAPKRGFAMPVHEWATPRFWKALESAA